MFDMIKTEKNPNYDTLASNGFPWRLSPHFTQSLNRYSFTILHLLLNSYRTFSEYSLSGGGHKVPMIPYFIDSVTDTIQTL